MPLRPPQPFSPDCAHDSSGLIGSEVATFFHGRGFTVHGVDNNQREAFFGPQCREG
jgi:hypothetical protein